MKSQTGINVRVFPPSCKTGAVECEEPRAAPGRAGDHAGDRRETGISRSLPALARDRDGVALPVILANQHGAGFELARGRAALARKTIQEGQAGAIKTAEGLLLEPHGDHAREQIFAQTRRRLAAEERLPAPPKRFGRKRADASDRGRDRSQVCHRRPHG